MCVFIVCASSTQFPKIKFVAFAVAVHLPACASHVLIKCSATQGYAASDQEMTLDDSVIELRRASACFLKIDINHNTGLLYPLNRASNPLVIIFSPASACLQLSCWS